MSKQSLIEWAKDSPQVGAIGLTVFGVSLEKWALIATAVWAVFRLVTAVVEFYWKVRDRKAFLAKLQEPENESK